MRLESAALFGSLRTLLKVHMGNLSSEDILRKSVQKENFFIELFINFQKSDGCNELIGAIVRKQPNYYTVPSRSKDDRS